jgi:hypothetical protein
VTAPFADDVALLKQLFPRPQLASKLVRSNQIAVPQAGQAQNTASHSLGLRVVAPTTAALKQLGLTQPALFGWSPGREPADVIDALITLVDCTREPAADALTPADATGHAQCEAKGHEWQGLGPRGEEILSYVTTLDAVGSAFGLDSSQDDNAESEEQSALSLAKSARAGAKQSFPVHLRTTEDVDGDAAKHPSRLEWLSLLCSLGIYAEAARDIMSWEVELTALLKKAVRLRSKAMRCLDMVRFVIAACPAAPLYTTAAEIEAWFGAVQSFPAVGLTIIDALAAFWPDEPGASMLSQAQIFEGSGGGTGVPTNTGSLRQQPEELQRPEERPWHMLVRRLCTAQGPAEQHFEQLLETFTRALPAEVPPSDFLETPGDEPGGSWLDWHERPVPPEPANFAGQASRLARVLQKLKAGPSGMTAPSPFGLDCTAASVGSGVEACAAECGDAAWGSAVTAAARILHMSEAGSGQRDATTSTAPDARSDRVALAAILILDCLRAGLAAAALAHVAHADSHALRTKIMRGTRGVVRYESHLHAATGQTPPQLRALFATPAPAR